MPAAALEHTHCTAQVSAFLQAFNLVACVLAPGSRSMHPHPQRRKLRETQAKLHLQQALTPPTRLRRHPWCCSSRWTPPTTKVGYARLLRALTPALALELALALLAPGCVLTLLVPVA